MWLTSLETMVVRVITMTLRRTPQISGGSSGMFLSPCLVPRCCKHCWCSGLAGAEELVIVAYAGENIPRKILAYTRENTWLQRSIIWLLKKPGPYSCSVTVFEDVVCLVLQGPPFPCCFCVL